MTASMLLMSALMLVSCDKTGGDDINMDAGFFVTIDKNVIQSNGEDFVTLKATLDGNDVTSEAVFYIVDGENPTPMTSNKFSTDKAGDYSFKASYLTFITEESVGVSAINGPIPTAAVDPQPSQTSFVHRSLLMQYTGTGCGACPAMIHALRAAFKDDETKNMAVHVAVHSFAAGDPAYISAPRTSNYPYSNIDMSVGFTYNLDPDATQGVLKSELLKLTKEPAKVGISANPLMVDDKLVVTVSVKAAKDGDYRVGLWLLQDNVYGQQKDDIGIADASYNYHDNCVRSTNSIFENSIFGYPIGTLKTGQTADYTFVLDVDAKAWKLNDLSDLHFAVFVTTAKTKIVQNMKVASLIKLENVVDCKCNEPTPFEYKK